MTVSPSAQSAAAARAIRRLFSSWMPLRYSKGSSPGCPSASSSAPPLTLRTSPDSSSVPRSRRMVASEDRAMPESSPTEANLFWRSTRRSRACRSADSILLVPADGRAHAPKVRAEVPLSIEEGRGSRHEQIGACIDHTGDVFPAHVSVHLDLDVQAALPYQLRQGADFVQCLGN